MGLFVPRTCFVWIILVKALAGPWWKTRLLFVRLSVLRRLLCCRFEGIAKRRAFTPDEKDIIWYTYWGVWKDLDCIAEADSLVPPVLEIV